VVGRRRPAVTAGALLTAGALVLAGCSPKPSGGAAAGSQPTAGATASPTPTPPAAADVLLSTSASATGVNPVVPVTASVRGGSLSKITLRNAAGTLVRGTLSADRTSWKSAEDLGYDTSYTLSAVAANASGQLTVKKASFTTVKPDNLTMPYLQTAAGGAIDPGVTFGVGQVVRVHFDEPIPDRKAAQAALSVTTTPAQIGAFSWLDDQNVYWRTKSYLKSGTKVVVTAKVYGKNFGNALYGQADVSTWFKVGAKHVSVADDNTKLISVYSDGTLVRTIPTSMGRHTSIAGDTGPIDLRTNSGPHVVVGGETKINMNSASFGLTKGANAYKTIVPVGVRISYDGEYVHWADWSVWAQGNTDTSHGCLNVSPDNAWWFYSFSRPGDIVDVRNTGRPLAEWNSGYWNVSWSSWLADSAH
jgi:lipoprotein-anchoring transpeptidase ErfK/SrfK